MAQFVINPDYQRWILKKPKIDSIYIEIHPTVNPEDSGFFSRSEIRSALYSKKYPYFRSFNLLKLIQLLKSDRRNRVQRETPLKDTSEVKYMYLSNGFLGVRVTETFEPMPKDSNALVSLFIYEGRQFVYDSVIVTGRFEKQFEGEFGNIAGRFEGSKPVNPFALKQAVYDIKAELANNGYPYATADYSIDTTTQSDGARIQFKVNSDSLVHFGDVRVLGANNYGKSVALRELTFKPGDIYRRKDIMESQRHLYQTGDYLTLQLYSTARDSTKGVNRLNPDFILSLREKNPQYVSIKTGASQDSIKDLTWTFSIAWGKRNLFRSRSIELSAYASSVIFTEWRFLEHSYRLRFKEPWFLGIRMPLTFTGEISPPVKDRVQNYKIRTWSVSFTTNREFGPVVKSLAGFEYESVKISGLSLEDQILLKQEKKLSNRRRFYLTVNRDSRSNPFLPTGGSLTNFSLEYAGGFLGGDDSFWKVDASWSRYQRFWPGWISATRLKFGNVRQFGSSNEVPVDVRYYLGGANTIRGFKENSLGPQTSEADPTPEGARIVMIANQEFRYKIIGKFWGSIFADAGNGYRNYSEIKPNTLALSYGTGIQFISPAGPIRLDYARRIRTHLYSAGYRFHFTILYAF